MNSRTLNYLDMLIRVRAFIINHNIQFSPDSHASKQFDIINDVINALTEQTKQVATTSKSVKQTTSNKDVHRADLQKMLGKIRISVKAIDNTNPGFAAKFTKSNKKGDRPLLADAMSTVSVVESMLPEFYKRDMAQDFIPRLKETISAFEQSLNSGAAAKNSRVNTTAEAEPLIAKAKIAMDEMNAIINYRYENDSAMLKEWESASRPKQAAKKKSTTKKPDPKKPDPQQPPAQ